MNEQEPLELFGFSEATRQKVVFFILSPSLDTQQEKALMASAYIGIVGEKYFVLEKQTMCLGISEGYLELEIFLNKSCQDHK